MYPFKLNIPLTPFFFDKYYIDDEKTELFDPISRAQDDGVSVNRYVFVDQPQKSGGTYTQSAYQKIYDDSPEFNNYRYIKIADFNSITEEATVQWQTW